MAKATEEDVKWGKSKDKMKKAGAGYRKMMKHMKKGIQTNDTVEKAKHQYVMTYQDDIEEFKSFSGRDDYKKVSDDSNISEMLVEYHLATHAGVASFLGRREVEDTKSLGSEFVKQSVRDQRKRGNLEQEEVKEQEGEAGISSEAKSGMVEISKWMLRNCDKTGVLGTSKGPWIRQFILQQPARVKLAAYYLVEKDARKLTGDKLSTAILESQLNYVPDLEKFKKKMVASKFKFWKRFDGSEFYWDKLEDSMRYAVQNQGIIMMYGSLGESGVQDTGSNASGAASTTDNTGGKKAKKESPLSISYANFKMAQRNLEAALKKEKDIKDKGGKPTNMQLRVKAIATQMYANELKHLTEELKKNAPDESVEGLGSDDRKTDKASTYIGYGDMGIDKTGMAVNKLIGLEKLKVSDAAQGYTSGIFGELETVTAIGLVVVDIIDGIKTNSYTTAGMKALKAFEIIESIADIGESTVGNIMDILQAAGTVTEEIAQFGAGIGGIVAGSIGYAVGFGEVISAGIQQEKMEKANKAIQGNKELSDHEKENMAHLHNVHERLMNAKAVDGSIKQIQGGLNILAGAMLMSGAGAAIAAVIGGISAAIGFGGKIIQFFMKKNNINETIDEYIHMDAIYQTMLGILNSQKTDDKKKIKEGDLKKQIRLEAAAQMGCSSINRFYSYIIGEYAQDLYSHIFFDKSGRPIEIDDKGKPKNQTETQKQYVDILKGLGLKPNYKKKKPSVNTIMKKLEN